MSQIASEQIVVDEFARTPYLNVLTYPKPDLRVAVGRLKQLRKLGVETVIFEGRTKIGRLGLVGIGTVSLVVRCTASGEVRALKVRRLDANRESMLDEFKLTQMANMVGVGGRAFAATKDFMLMQYVRGEELDDTVLGLKGKGTRERLREVIHRLLNQCRKLDLVNLDHGQLSDLRKHVIMDGGLPYIIDFESGSTGRTPKNVTSAAQYLLIGGRLAPLVNRLLGTRDSAPTMEALKRYKREMSDENYVRLLSTFGVRT